MLILLSLSCLILISIFAIVVGSSIKKIGLGSIVSDAVVGGNETSYSLTNLSETFYIDEFAGAIVIIIVIISICAIIGIRIFYSGLSDVSIKMITLGITYTSIWSVFSTLSYSLIVSIEIVGALLYIVLTTMYVIGIIQKFSEI